MLLLVFSSLDVPPVALDRAARAGFGCSLLPPLEGGRKPIAADVPTSRSSLSFFCFFCCSFSLVLFFFLRVCPGHRLC